MHHVNPDTHTHTHYNIIDETNAADAHVVFWSSVDQPPRTPTHTQTHTFGRQPTLTANRVIILLRTDFIIIISSRVQ